MAATESQSTYDLSVRVARRALDIAQDPGVSRADGGNHLARLAGANPSALQLALSNLRSAGSTSPQAEHACLLLQAGLVGLTEDGSQHAERRRRSPG